MTDQDKRILRTAIMTISHPIGNWHHGWEMICEVANLNPNEYTAPFRDRSDTELYELARNPKPQSK